MKIQISIDDNLLVRADTFANQNYLSRSGLVALSLSHYLRQEELLSSIKNCSLAIQKVAHEGKLDPKTVELFNEFQTVSNIVLNNKLK